MSPGTPAGVYVHVPFCRKKCRYCDFYSIADISLTEDYLAAVTAEIGRSAEAGTLVDTVYVGGGTPSLLGPAGIGRILERVAAVFSVAPDAEVTIEVNPGAVSAGDVEGYAAAGVNRLSVGVQSFNDAALAFLGRIHTASQAAETLNRARDAGIANLGLDLIYGLPDQRPEDWAADLSAALSFAPEHISCYMLTVEPGTPLDVDRTMDRFSPLSDERTGALFRQSRRTIRNGGYLHYEISNFSSTAATMSRHNRKYWSGAPYYGFGPSAHSFLPPIRRWNAADVGRYIDAVSTGAATVAGQERLTREQAMMEMVMLGLRQTAGIDINRFNDVFGVDFHDQFSAVLPSMEDRGLVVVDQTGCRLTEEGMVVMDAVVARMVGDICP
ncbi:MAG: radical SAM family heme chaperone HemW [Pseudomonadota bacterium]